MIATKREASHMANILADICAQASLIEMGAITEKEKLFEKIDKLKELMDGAQIVDIDDQGRAKVS